MMICDVCTGPLPPPERVKWTYYPAQSAKHGPGYSSMADGVYCSLECAAKDTLAARKARRIKSRQMTGDPYMLRSILEAS